jgi:hypothetical protein
MKVSGRAAEQLRSSGQGTTCARKEKKRQVLKDVRKAATTITWVPWR